MQDNRWQLGLRPRPRWGSLRRSPRPPSRIESDAYTCPPLIFYAPPPQRAPVTLPWRRPWYNRITGSLNIRYSNDRDDGEINFCPIFLLHLKISRAPGNSGDRREALGIVAVPYTPYRGLGLWSLELTMRNSIQTPFLISLFHNIYYVHQCTK